MADQADVSPLTQAPYDGLHRGAALRQLLEGERKVNAV